MRAVGVRKVTSKLAGSLEPFAEIEAYLIQAKGAPKIGGAVVQHRFQQLSRSSAAIQAGWFVSRFVNSITRSDVPDPDLYQLIYSTLTWLDTKTIVKTILCSFAFKCIRLQGYEPMQLAPNPAVAKVVSWLVDQSYSEVQKLRLSDDIWRGLIITMQAWFDDHTTTHVQLETLLV